MSLVDLDVEIPEWAVIKNLVSMLADFALPRQCPWCQKAAPFPEAPGTGDFCDHCQKELIGGSSDYCLRCSAEVGPHLDTSAGCAICRKDRFAFQQAVSLGKYQGGLRAAVIRSKLPGGDPLAAALATHLWKCREERIRRWSCHAIVAVPHHWIERSFRNNIPASTIADVLGRFLMVPVARHILAKRRWTRPQASLSATQRRQNLKDAFRISGHARLDGLKLLVVDDVMTTGTTADRVARTLKSAGAAEVYVAVIARGTGHEPNPTS